MNKFDRTLRALQPNIKNIARSFLLDRTFGDTETSRIMTIAFTLPRDSKLGYRRIQLETHRCINYIPPLSYDIDLILYGVKKESSVPVLPEVKQTLKNVMSLIDFTPVEHVVYISTKKTYVKNETLYYWRDVADIASEAAK